MTSNKNVIHENQPFIPRFALIAIVILSVSLISVLLVKRLMPPESIQSGSIDFVQATQAYIPGQAMTITAENVTVYVPQDSVNMPGTISIISREPNLFPVAGQANWTRPQIINIEFLNAEGTPVPGIIFSSPIQVCFKITPQQWEDFTQRPGAYRIEYYAVENNPPAWQVLPMTTYSDVSMLCGQVNHLSLFALAIRMDEVLPVTGSSATPSLSPTLPGARRTPIRTDPPPLPGSTNTSVPLPTSTQPPPTFTDPPPMNTPPPTETPPPIEPTPTDGLPLPIPTLPTLPTGP